MNKTNFIKISYLQRFLLKSNLIPKLLLNKLQKKTFPDSNCCDFDDLREK